MTNTELWDKLKRVPTEHLKGFKRAGGFSGTAIKPMWTVHRMTEEFGPCGVGWGIGAPSFHVVPGSNNEVLVYCMVSIWHGEKTNVVFGVGGDKVVSHVKANEQYKRPERWDSDDEAFKKAFTDAVTNALKFIGTGADVHMGLFDGSKYVDEKKPKDNAGPHSPDNDIERPPESDLADANGTKGAPKRLARNDYERLVNELRECATVDACVEWGKSRKAEINKLPQDWVAHMETEYLTHRDSLKEKAA
jgi:hypothetical protein